MEDDGCRPMDHTSSILSMVKQFLELEECNLWDVKVQVGTKVFKCLRAILAANSEYFRTKFVSSRRYLKITLPDDMDATAFKRILYFMYSGVLYVKGKDNIINLLVLSDFLKVRTDYLKERIVKHVEGRSKESKRMSFAFDLLRHACDNGEDELVDIVSAHVCRHLHHFSNDPKLMEFSFEHLNALLERSQNYIIPLRGSADLLVKIVHSWINHNREVRSQYRHELTKNIDFATVSSDVTRSWINRLENVVDQVLNPPPGVGSLSESEALEAALEDVLLDKTAALREVISLNVPNISELAIGEEIISSPFSIISNVPWEISFERNTSDAVDVNLRCKVIDFDSEWNIYAEAYFVIKSHKVGGVDFGRCLGLRLFSSTENHSWTMESFLPWEMLVDEENGYIADDDSVTLMADVQADVLFLSYNPQINIDND